MTEQTHIKNALSRIVVEIAKREWPQEWQSMIADLNNIYAQGVTLHFSFCHSSKIKNVEKNFEIKLNKKIILQY